MCQMRFFGGAALIVALAGVSADTRGQQISVFSASQNFRGQVFQAPSIAPVDQWNFFVPAGNFAPGPQSRSYTSAITGSVATISGDYTALYTSSGFSLSTSLSGSVAYGSSPDAYFRGRSANTVIFNVLTAGQYNLAASLVTTNPFTDVVRSVGSIQLAPFGTSAFLLNLDGSNPAGVNLSTNTNVNLAVGLYTLAFELRADPGTAGTPAQANTSGAASFSIQYIPSPGVAALFGLAGVAASRRRR